MKEPLLKCFKVNHTTLRKMDGELALALLLVLLTLVSLCFWRHVRKFRILEELGYPHPPLHFFYGNAREVNFGSMKPVDTVTEWKKEHGNIFGYYIGTRPTLVIADLDLVQKVAIKDFDHFTDHFFVSSEFDVLKDSLMTIKGDHWKRVRKAITPALSPAKLKRIYPIVVSCISQFDECLTELLKLNEDINMHDRFLRLSLDIIGRTILAMDINCQSEPDNNLLRNVSFLLDHTASTKLFACGNNIPGVNTILKLISTFHPTYQTIVQIEKHLKRVVEMRKGNLKSGAVVDILQMMLEATDAKLHQQHGSSSNAKEKCEPLLSDKELASNCLMFLIAGMETTATTLTYVAYMLAKHDKIQEKLYQEIVSSVKDVSQVSSEDRANLPYMEKVVNETLRLFPPATTSNRVCVKDYDYNGRRIPKGMKVDIPTYCIHHDPDIWPDPETFDPERFSAENRTKIHPVAHIPFGLGPRNCIGMRLAMMIIKATLVTFLSKYKLEPPTTVIYPPELRIPLIILCPKQGVFVKLKPRNP